MSYIVITMLVILFGSLISGIWVGITLAMTGTSLLFIFRDIPVDKLIAQYAWNILTTQELIALPLFIVMGEILFRTRLSRSLFDGLAPWAGLLPGRLLHVNIVGSTIFAAISGSSTATTQVIGRVSLSELLRRGYERKIAIGSLAGAGTLGFLIPPSSIMIVYGVLAQVSIVKLFAAGLIPGILLAACFMAWVMLHSTVRTSFVPEQDAALRHLSWRVRFAALKDLMPIALLIMGVLGCMYGGIATPSEAAAIGVVGALVLAGAQRQLTLPVLERIAVGSILTCAMIALIVLGASILGSAAAFLGVPRVIAQFVGSLGLSPMALIFVLILVYLVLGCFLEGYSMIVITLPVALPIVVAAGFDPIWFGVFLVLVVEMAQITPPAGFNLLIIQGITGENLGYVARASLPYLAIMIAFTLALAAFPQVVLWLPGYI